MCRHAVRGFEEIRVRADFKIDSIEPARGLIGADVDVTIKGEGFGTSGSLNTGTDIDATDVHFTPKEIFAVFKIKSTAAGGNHSIKVIVAGKEHSADFFVQIPTRLRRDSITGLIDQQGGCGAYRTVSYTLLDQAGQPIDVDGVVDEILSNYSGPPDKAPKAVSANMLGGRVDDLVGYDTATPDCPPPFTATVTQNLSAKIGAVSYAMTTTNSLSVGRDSAGGKFVNITIVRP